MNTNARIIQVIEIIETRGTGTEEDPVRRVTCYVDLKGNFLAENDSYTTSKTFNKELYEKKNNKYL